MGRADAEGLESQRERAPLEDGGERATALAFLDFARHCVLKKVEGLPDADLRRRLVPSDTTLLGLLQHLVDGERYWFDHVLTGDPTHADVDFSMAVPAGRTGTELVAEYRAAIERSNRNLEAVDLDDLCALVPETGPRRSVRWVVAHMTSEVARHAGHADILREQVDGVTGR